MRDSPESRIGTLSKRRFIYTLIGGTTITLLGGSNKLDKSADTRSTDSLKTGPPKSKEDSSVNIQGIEGLNKNQGLTQNQPLNNYSRAIVREQTPASNIFTDQQTKESTGLNTSLSEQERKDMRAKIVELQESIGIFKIEAPGDPMLEAFVANSLKKENQRAEWGGTDDQFQNKLPNQISRFGELAKFISNKAFQNNSGRVIKGARTDTQNHDQMAFNHSSDRYILFYEDIVNAGVDYISLSMVHEIIGHGSDPEFLSNVYPYDIFLQLELAQWELLSKVASVPNAFINDSSNVISKELATSIGQAVGKHFLTGKTPTSSEDTRQIEKMLEDTFKSTDINNKVLNSIVCYQFGAELFRQIAAGRIHLPEEVKKDYSDAWFDQSHQNKSNHRSEIYADMVSRLIMNPGLSPELFHFCEDILSLYSPDKQVHFKNIGQQVTSMTKYILSQTKSNTSPALQETSKAKLSEENYECFISSEACKVFGHGFADIDESTLPPKIDNNLHLFRDNILIAYTKYPTLKDSNSLHINPNFAPPDLTPEQADQLRNLADSNYIRWLVEALNSRHNFTELEQINLEQKAKGLEGFLKKP